MRCKPCDRNTPDRNGGQGRNRTNDTRIFSPANWLFRLKKPEETHRLLAGPTDLSAPDRAPAGADLPDPVVGSFESLS